MEMRGEVEEEEGTVDVHRHTVTRWGYGLPGGDDVKYSPGCVT